MRLFYFLAIILIISCGSNSDNPEVVVPPTTTPPTSDGFAVDIGDSEIPYIIIQTNGNTILNEPKVAAEMTIYENKEAIMTTPIGIEYRGSTSYRLSTKKSFGIETWDEEGNDKAVSIFGFPEEEDWILLGHVANPTTNTYFDRTLIYNYIGHTLSNNIGRYASRTKLVELQIDDRYQGIYVFAEKLKRDGDRIDINKLKEDEVEGEDVTGGYILQIDKTSGGLLGLEGQPLSYFDNNWDDDSRYLESFSFRSNYDINGDSLTLAPLYNSPYHSNMYLETYFIYNYPKPEDIQEAQKTYIQNYIHEFERALTMEDFSTEERAYLEYMDMESFVDYFLLNELFKNIDAFRLSTYLVKDKNEKLEMGPIWDLNIGFNIGTRLPDNAWIIDYNDHVQQDAWMMPFWWPKLIQDPIFQNAVKTRWESLRADEFSDAALQNIVSESSDYLINNGAIDRNSNVWGSVNYASEIAALHDFLDRRANWMDNRISEF